MAVGEPTKDFQPHQPRVVYFSKQEIEVAGGSLSTEDAKLTIPIHVPTEGLIYSNSSSICRGALEQQGLNATTALLTLAAAGVDIALQLLKTTYHPRHESKGDH